nr:unnamed protein product [Digitaria exilis]
MASLSAPPTLPRASPAVAGAARGRMVRVRVRAASAALGGGCCGGGGDDGMEQHRGDGSRSPVLVAGMIVSEVVRCSKLAAEQLRQEFHANCYIFGAGEVAKLFADAGIICIASLISPYRRDRDACRALLPDSKFIEVFIDLPLKICEARDPKGLYKLARTGKIKGANDCSFTGIDDPYEPPVNGEIVIKMKDGECPSPKAMAKQVLCYLEENGFLQA